MHCHISSPQSLSEEGNRVELLFRRELYKENKSYCCSLKGNCMVHFLLLPLVHAGLARFLIIFLNVSSLE